MRSAAVVVAALVGWSTVALGVRPAVAGCFMACTMEDLKAATLLDDTAVRDAARRCKAACEGQAVARVGGKAALAACHPAPLAPAELARVLAVSPRFQILLGVFAWEAVNPFPDKVLTGITVSRATPSMARQTNETEGTVPPDADGAFVVTEMGELIPQLGPTLKVDEIRACPVPAK